jgi:hypothetical protein
MGDVIKKLVVLFPLLAATTAFASPGRMAKRTTDWYA